ncbi:uncharacterized protein LY89DRAFT_684364 [Mollisia scopiformis]|uniref:Uncharacterized protein n=1 Tax=Mollisia scopiformis TaxID=149040 RepID=A0A194XAS6_MOLSC|nr:uncharacterized protein LY89DRAFT_684364 [Mollisia scopiformis]KUJ17270.1 hypothetical protein LY89DRAFT_684364 [Mollisia scopiformis]
MAPQRTTGKVQKRTSHRGGPKQARRGSVESESSDGTLRASNIEPGHEASRKMLKRFAAKVGKVVTLEQVAAASQWMTSMQCTENDLQKFATFNSHAEKIGLQKVWPEIIMYRSIGQISTYFLDGQRLRNGGQSDINALDELEISVVGWVRLASEGRLSRLEESAEIEDGEGQYSTQAERFKTFLTEFKHRGNFTVWNYDQMKMLRYMIYKVVHEPVGLEHTPRQSTGKIIARFRIIPFAYHSFRSP